MDEKRYKEYLINRLRIAKQGLQAKILWCGKEKNIDEILLQKIDKIEHKFSKRFNYKFKIIPEMIKKRITQADFALEIFKKLGRDVLNYILKIEKAFFENEFREYLKNSKKLKSLKPPAFEEVIDEFVKEDTSILYPAELLRLPLEEFERIIKNLERKGKVKIQKDLEYGILISNLFK